jgi:hypothetical protein
MFPVEAFKDARATAPKALAPQVFPILDRREELGLGAKHVADQRGAFALPDVGSPLLHFDSDQDLISRRDGVPELRLIDPCEHEHVQVRIDRVGRIGQHAHELRHRLQAEHRGKHRRAWEVAGEERFVVGDALDRAGRLARFEIDDAVDEQER